ncbi:hypothetical protein M404DRAFT_1002883 [Pisolithus tinctorius Marx 270]|uniref:Uncharacterized protein n=1 Tax=Pisolithus tinctorius Marx 270 TaxID=870435 RepID=A0A0C3P386_PISTI|nr:hypothetical protein M404DRAFT_1002883 [Pisolithus tinctorius Marx 270]
MIQVWIALAAPIVAITDGQPSIIANGTPVYTPYTLVSNSVVSCISRVASRLGGCMEFYSETSNWD